MAIEQAIKSKGIGGGGKSNKLRRKNSQRIIGYRIGAVLINNGIVLAKNYNKLKTHPKMLEYSEYPYVHAESACLLSLKNINLKDYKNLTMYTARVTLNGRIAIAKPCCDCIKMMKDYNVKSAIYTTKYGIEQMDI